MRAPPASHHHNLPGWSSFRRQKSYAEQPLSRTAARTRQRRTTPRKASQQLRRARPVNLTERDSAELLDLLDSTGECHREARGHHRKPGELFGFHLVLQTPDKLEAGRGPRTAHATS